MVRKIVLWSLISLCSVFMHAARITVQITQPLKNLPVLYLPDSESLTIPVDKDGRGEVTFQPSQAGYIKIGYNYVTRLFWIEPNSTLNLSFTGVEYYNSVRLSGDQADINRYLNEQTIPAAQINDTGLSEEAFIQKSDSLLSANRARLQASGLSESFQKQEARRLKYYVHQTLPSYPVFHKRISGDTGYQPSALYWNKLKQITEYDATLLVFEDYQQFLVESVRELSRYAFPDLKGIDRLTAFIEREIKDREVAGYLVYRNVYSYVKKHGLDDVEPYQAAFRRYVTNPTHIKQYQQLCQEVSQLGAGALSPDFNATDLSGKKVSLKSFRGKYVLIDIWATWCVPCRREIPHLNRLEEKFRDAAIYFVSLSCDTNRKAWEKKVTTDQMKGIQLHLSDDSFLKKYMVQGVPRFILLDPEGRIISPDMTRPSDPATEAMLTKLLNN